MFSMLNKIVLDGHFKDKKFNNQGDVNNFVNVVNIIKFMEIYFHAYNASKTWVRVSKFVNWIKLKAPNFKTDGRLVKWQEQLKTSKKIRVWS